MDFNAWMILVNIVGVAFSGFNLLSLDRPETFFWVIFLAFFSYFCGDRMNRGINKVN